MKNAQLASTDCLLTVPPALDVTRAGDHQVVHLGATPIASFPVSDVSTRRLFGRGPKLVFALKS